VWLAGDEAGHAGHGERDAAVFGGVDDAFADQDRT